MTSNKVGAGEVLNVGTGECTKIIDIARLFNGVISHSPPRENDVLSTCADIRLTTQLLDWRPQIEFKEGLNRLIG